MFESSLNLSKPDLYFCCIGIDIGILVSQVPISDKRHMKFVVSLPLDAAQGNHSATPMGRGRENIALGSHAETSSV